MPPTSFIFSSLPFRRQRSMVRFHPCPQQTKKELLVSSFFVCYVGTMESNKGRGRETIWFPVLEVSHSYATVRNRGFRRSELLYSNSRREIPSMPPTALLRRDVINSHPPNRRISL